MCTGLPRALSSTDLEKNFQILFWFAWKFRRKQSITVIRLLVKPNLSVFLIFSTTLPNDWVALWVSSPLLHNAAKCWKWFEDIIKVWITHHQIKKTLWLKIGLDNNALQVEITLITHDSTSGTFQWFKKSWFTFLKRRHPDVTFPGSEHQTAVNEEMTMQPFSFSSLIRGLVISQHSIWR